MAETQEQNAETEHKEGYHVHADGTVHAGDHHHEGEEEADKYPANVVTLEDAGVARKRLKIEISPERIKGKMDEAFGELQKDAVLPGFRRGRAPKRLLEKRFGTDLKSTVKGQIVAEAYQKAVEEQKIDAIGEPEIDMSKIELPESGPLTINLEVEVTPQFDVPDVKDLEIKRPIMEATDERLGLAIDNLRRHFGHWNTVSDGVQDNDGVTVDIKIQDAENQILLEQPAVQLLAKAGNIAGIRFEDLGEKLKGVKPSEKITLEGKVPDDHTQENLRGKDVRIELEVKQIRRQHLPEVNEEFVAMLGFENVEELKKELRERLVVQLEQETKGAMAQQVYSHLLKTVSLELPVNLSQRQMGNVLRRRATEMMNKGVPEADIVQHLDELKISSAQQAQVDLKLFFILSKLADKYEIKVNDAEVNARIASIAEQYGRRPERLLHDLQKNNQIEQLFLQVRDGKVVDKILETAKITDVDEKALAEEFKNEPPLVSGPHVQGISHSAKK
jgi:trigger factor